MELNNLDVVQLFELRHTVNKAIADKEKMRYDAILDARRKKETILPIALSELVDYINERIDIRNPRRYEKFIFPRFSLFIIMNMDYEISLKALSREFGCDHATVLNGVNTALELLDSRNHEKYARFLESYTKIKTLVLEFLNNSQDEQQ